jgi:CHASE2 domain-containing sensor protein
LNDFSVIQAIANCPPHEIPQDDEGDWAWGAIDATLSPETRNLVAEMTTYSIAYRRSNHGKIIQEILNIQDKYFIELTKVAIRKKLKYLFETLLISILITAFITGLRYLGVLQNVDLFVYDKMIQMRPDINGKDSKILIIKVTSEDTKRQEQLNIEDSSSLSDIALERLLNKIQAYGPSVIGIDIARKNNIPAFSSENIILGCGSSSLDADFQIAPPKNFPLKRVGYFDIKIDSFNKTIRRQVLIGKGAPHCDPGYSFSYQIAKKYLARKNLLIEEENSVILNGKPIKRLRRHHAFYSRINDSGYQTLLNYRTNPQVAETIELFDILDDKLDDETLRQKISNKIILVGTTDRFFGDLHSTPYGIQSGVTVQAHMVSDLVDTALGKRKNLNYASRSLETLFLWICTLIGLSTLIFSLPRASLLILIALSLLLLLVSYYSLIFVSFVLPLGASWLALLLISLYIFRNWQKAGFGKQKRAISR